MEEPVSLSFEPWNWEEVKGQLEEVGSDQTKSLRAIRQTIVILHKLLAAFLADWYYLNILQRYRAAYNYELKTLANLEIKKPKVWYCVDILYGHSNYVFSIAVNPDGETFVSGSADKNIKIWDIQTGELIETLTGHSNCVCSVAFFADGQKIASSSYDKTFKLWNCLKSKTFIEHSLNIQIV